MRVLYHLTVLPPHMPGAEALSQEITALRTRVGGDLVYLNPNQRSPFYVPRFLFGFHRLRDLWRREKNHQIHHFYNPDPFPFPVLRWLRRPIVYTISSGVDPNRRPNPDFFARLGAVAVADERSLKTLKAWGLTNAVLVRAGIDTGRFRYSPYPLEKKPIRLMVGSAPWTKGQFKSKGVEALLEAARQRSELHLVFLWRGVLADEMLDRVSRYGLENQVQVLNQEVDVNQVLADVHASIALADAPGIIKSYPHSLLDSLAAGKPVLVSQAIAMADYVREMECGEVVEAVNAEGILTALETLVSHYEGREKAAQIVGQRDFSLAGMLDSYKRIYQNLSGLRAD